MARMKSQAEVHARQKEIYSSARFKVDYPFGDPTGLLMRKYVSFVLRHLAKGSEVLDIGCGDGTMTRALLAKARRVVGIDLSAECIRRARLGNGDGRIEYFWTSIEDFTTKDVFDVAIMSEVLEHVFEPISVLKKVRALLGKHGLLIMSTPNASSLVRRVECLPAVRQIYTAWRGRDPGEPISEEHFWEYTYQEIEHMLVEAGFRIMALTGYGGLIPHFVVEALGWLIKEDFFYCLGSIAPRLSAHIHIVAQK